MKNVPQSFIWDRIVFNYARTGKHLQDGYIISVQQKYAASLSHPTNAKRKDRKEHKTSYLPVTHTVVTVTRPTQRHRHNNNHSHTKYYIPCKPCQTLSGGRLHFSGGQRLRGRSLSSSFLPALPSTLYGVKYLHNFFSSKCLNMFVKMFYTRRTYLQK